MRFLCLAASLALSFAFAVPAAAEDTPGVKVSAIVEADLTTTLIHEVVLDAPPAEVWSALATPEGWMRWAVPLARWVEGEPDLLETAYDPAAAPGSAATIRQRVVARVPDRLLAFRTEKAPQGFPHFDEYRKVTSVFELEPRGERTLLRLISAGYPANEAGRELVTFFTTGNAKTLEELRKLFATP